MLRGKAMNKEILRQEMLKKRLSIDIKDIASYSVMIKDRLMAHKSIQNAACIMAYYPHKNEPDLRGFMDACLDMGKCVALPYVMGEGEMIAVDFHADSAIKSNVYGIPEPVMSSESDMAEPDVIIVPGIAFSKKLHRIGFGSGYYDRYLCGTDALKIGVCFDRFIVDDTFTDAHDIAMDIVVTQNRVLGDK